MLQSSVYLCGVGRVGSSLRLGVSGRECGVGNLGSSVRLRVVLGVCGVGSVGLCVLGCATAISVTVGSIWQ